MSDFVHVTLPIVVSVVSLIVSAITVWWEYRRYRKDKRFGDREV